MINTNLQLFNAGVALRLEIGDWRLEMRLNSRVACISSWYLTWSSQIIEIVRSIISRFDQSSRSMTASVAELIDDVICSVMEFCSKLTCPSKFPSLCVDVRGAITHARMCCCDTKCDDPAQATNHRSKYKQARFIVTTELLRGADSPKNK